MTECDYCGCEIMDLSEAHEYEDENEENGGYVYVCNSYYEEASE